MLLEIRCVVAVSHDGLLVCPDFSTMKTVNLLCICAFALPIQQKRSVPTLGSWYPSANRESFPTPDTDSGGSLSVEILSVAIVKFLGSLNFYTVIYLFYLLKRNSDECIV